MPLLKKAEEGTGKEHLKYIPEDLVIFLTILFLYGKEKYTEADKESPPMLAILNIICGCIYPSHTTHFSNIWC